jgi:hypothetical protein
VKSEPAKLPRLRRLYIDTSAYLCMLLAQEGAERLSKETAGAQLLSSVLLVLETTRNWCGSRERAVCNQSNTRTRSRVWIGIWGLFILRDLTLELCQTGMMPAVSTPRSLDLGHLRTALWFDAEERIDRFVTMDTAQEQSAKELGLPV